jgi:hypothetical protein
MEYHALLLTKSSGFDSRWTYHFFALVSADTSNVWACNWKLKCRFKSYREHQFKVCWHEMLSTVIQAAMCPKSMYTGNESNLINTNSFWICCGRSRQLTQSQSKRINFLECKFKSYLSKNFYVHVDKSVKSPVSQTGILRVRCPSWMPICISTVALSDC